MAKRALPAPLADAGHGRGRRRATLATPAAAHRRPARLSQFRSAPGRPRAAYRRCGPPPPAYG
ncbi:hypothetical protein GCM10009078_45470 [Cupriavidus gilardii]